MTLHAYGSICSDYISYTAMNNYGFGPSTSQYRTGICSSRWRFEVHQEAMTMTPVAILPRTQRWLLLSGPRRGGAAG